MLVPGERRLLLDLLAPPEEYAVDQALGTTYTLDLAALLRVPLAATALPWANADGGPTENPFALLTALRRNASRFSLFCHAGATRAPGTFSPLMTFLEDVVHPVAPPRDGGVLHPKTSRKLGSFAMNRMTSVRGHVSAPRAVQESHVRQILGRSAGPRR